MPTLLLDCSFSGCARDWSRHARVLDRQDRTEYFATMIAHQLQTAKQRFSAVAEKAAKGIPQLVTKHGRPFVVIVSAEDWRRDREPERGIWDVLRSCPADLSELALARSKDLPRKVTL